jgi:hypothetical protein
MVLPLILKMGHSRTVAIIVGAIGAFAGGFLVDALGIRVLGSLGGNLLWNIVVSGIGGLLALVLFRRLFSPVSVSPQTNVPAQSTISPSASAPKQQRTHANSSRQNNIFLSYRRADSAEITGRISDKLIAHFGRDAVFQDVDSIPFGLDFREYLNDTVGKCNALVAVIGPDWLNVTDEIGTRRLDDPADFVRIEIAAALSRNILVVPLLVRGAIMPKEDDLPADLKPLAFRNASQARNDPDFHHDMDRLISSLERTLTQKSKD